MPDRPHFEIRGQQVRQDDANVTGFGKTVVRDDFGQHGAHIRNQARQFRESAAGSLDGELTGSLFAQLEVPLDRSIRAEREKLRQVGLDLISVSPTNERIGTVRIEKNRFSELQRRIDRYADTATHVGKTYLSVIENIAPVPPEAKVPPGLDLESDEPIDCVLYLYKGLTPFESQAITRSLEEFLSARDREATHQTYSNEVSTVQASLTPREMLETGQSFSTVRSIKPDRALYFTDATPLAVIPDGIIVEPPTGATSVAVFDTGIANCNSITPAISGRLPYLPPGATTPHCEHGTYVASRVVFGDDVEGTLQQSPVRPNCSVIDVPIMGRSANGAIICPNESHLAAALENVVPQLPDTTRVLNLSIGNEEPVNDGEVSFIAKLLDHLSREYNVLAVVSAGNVRDTRVVQQYPQAVRNPSWRIDSPGESLLALTVGSCAQFVDGNCLSQPGEVSPFSRRGPGIDGGLKPEVVAHGGNCRDNGRPTSRTATRGIVSAGCGLGWDLGTSFAAPVVSGMAAQLFDHYEDARATLVKALLSHFTKPIEAPGVPIDARYLTGFGEPDLASAMWAGEHAAAYLHSGKIRKDTYQYLPFYVPADLASGGNARLQIKVTLIYDPPVNPDDDLAYSCSRMSVLLRKPLQLGFRDVHLSGDSTVSTPWNPVIQARKSFTRSFDTGVWELRVRLWTRQLRDDFEQSYSVVIEVIDGAGGVDVWAAIGDESNEYQLIHIREAA